MGFFRRWRDAIAKAAAERADARAKAAAERADLQRRFEDFLSETEPFVSESAHPKAALYRHAWKRAAVLGTIYQNDPVRVAHYQQLEKLAGEQYFKVAPETVYGKAPLRMSGKTGTRLLEMEMQRLFPRREKQVARPLACIYIGTCNQGRVYVGQTVDMPESRWLQHRHNRTGPFKKGEPYVRWEVIEGGINPTKLNERESYYIGLYNAHKNGYNETQGNDWRAYQRGVEDRIKFRTP
jgi:predicted GIY-YIG superfamily endonuclease